MAEGVLAEIAERKRRDVTDRLAGVSFDPAPTRRSLRAALSQPGARFLMEVKKASPSGHRSDVSVEQAVAAYTPVADAISVLTDTPFFQGSLEDLRTVRSRFEGPILAKDFIVDPRQVAEARLSGADAALVILAMLDDAAAAAVMAEARRLAMDVIVEVHDETELRRALALGAQVVGINNRDLRTLKTDLAVTERLANLVPDGTLVISESGVRDRRDVERLAPSVDAFLVGSALMASANVAEAARALVHGHIKICGLTNEDDAAMSARKATHAGLIFADISPRNVADRAPSLVDEIRDRGARPVGVFQDQGHEFVGRTAKELGLAAVQLHGGEGDLDRLRAKLPEDCEIWAVSAVRNEVSPERAGADRILYDTSVNGRTGGTGHVFDWGLLADRPELADAFVAGGISPSNARDAQALGSYGIDVCSGVEAFPGRKDLDKVAHLFEAVRPACRRRA
ncbi:bifunctional indole-3-glycerol-phosphate synthase TrpC/phosphoribosylanthranilate isomerase TrpF [Sphingomonas daechungensis]|uniref:bifunctional indole-3-glycerol-phosphate synthase TrpC/phosphoribosylanthranilate isomerase TrpF n=1 Tax=Sphingomonas daechungensis TaxID=1176646 RepID=UPI0031E564B4